MTIACRFFQDTVSIYDLLAPSNLLPTKKPGETSSRNVHLVQERASYCNLNFTKEKAVNPCAHYQLRRKQNHSVIANGKKGTVTKVLEVREVKELAQ